LNRLWAPWRSAYIKGGNNRECIFCIKEKSRNDREELILKKGNNAFIVMNLYPYNPGHIMIVPYKHTGNIEEIDNDTFIEIKLFLDLSLKILKEHMNVQGFNIGFNIGRIAGAGVEDHVHMHIVPRWNGDNNFMPVIGQTRVISMNIFELYDELYTYYK
jgi:ATP adenylyltransferase